MSQPTEVSYPVGPLPVDAKESIAAIMREVGLANLSIRVLRRRLETKYKLEFTSHKEKIQEYVDELMGTKEFKKEMALIHKGTEEAAKSKKAPKATKATTSKGASEKKERTSSKTEKAVKAPRVAKEKKPDNYPKAALTGYFLFLNDKRAEVRAANPSAGVAELGKLLGSMWKEVSDADKQKYNDLAAADKKRFEKEMEEYEAAGGEKFKRGGKKDKKGSKKSKKEKKDGPKRATSAFMFFINGKRKEINEANPGIKITAVPKIAADMWKNLTPEESAPWHALAAKDKERYAKECAEGGSTRAPAKKRSKTEAAPSSSSSSSSDSDSSSDSSSDSDSSDSSSSDSDSD